jgi:hypothetical protein
MAVFKFFSFINLLNEETSCACTTAHRLIRFYDLLTINETSNFSKTSLHVQTTDLSIIQHSLLQDTLSQGLNHIPFRPTNISETVAVFMDAFEQLADILQLATLQFPLEEARSYMHSTCLNALKSASIKKIGLKNIAKFMLDLPTVKNEINWLLKHLYCSGLDKATNNACFTCIKHIRLQALEQLMGNDFVPCKNDHIWLLPTSILNEIKLDLKSLLP